ncbi:MAG: phosphate acetyltransferase [Nitratireductor sp.]|nr:phosphate acetyltransferase [Nitratireductor sp.]
MNVIDAIFDTARSRPCHVILPEGDDPRVVEAAIEASRLSIAQVTVMASEIAAVGIADRLAVAGAKVELVIAGANELFGELVSEYSALRGKRGVSVQNALEQMRDPLTEGAMRVRLGLADGMVAGSIATTAHTVRTALQVLGKAEGVSTVSSFFLMAPPAGHHSVDAPMIFADCGLLIEPNASQLADIAIASARSCQLLLGEAPRVAMLSFSTAGSAVHSSLDKMRSALAMVREREPGLEIDGEFQFDSAFDEAIRQRKAPGSRLSGRPNVYIFPDLASGNIGYKIAQRIGGLSAIGPILQGLARPANDLSRGCAVDEIVAAIAVTAVQAGKPA